MLFRLTRCFAEQTTLSHEMRYLAPVARVSRDLIVTYVLRHPARE